MASKQTYLTKKTKDPTDGYMTVPYTGKPSLRFQRRLRKEMEQYGLTIVPSYTTTKIGSYFSLKSSPSMPFKSNVVYEFHCSCDKNTTYIGETTRQFFKRVADHTGKDQKSAVLDHISQCCECQQVDNIFSLFTVIEQGTSTNICSLESLWISRKRPVLNTQLGPSKGKMVSLALYKG